MYACQPSLLPTSAMLRVYLGRRLSAILFCCLHHSGACLLVRPVHPKHFQTLDNNSNGAHLKINRWRILQCKVKWHIWPKLNKKYQTAKRESRLTIVSAVGISCLVYSKLFPLSELKLKGRISTTSAWGSKLKKTSVLYSTDHTFSGTTSLIWENMYLFPITDACLKQFLKVKKSTLNWSYKN